MRIVLSGAQGTGKSTLVKEISKLLPGLNIIDSISAKHAISKDDFKEKNKVLNFQTNLSIEYFDILRNTKDYISSRGFADICAYCYYDYLKYIDVERFRILTELCCDFSKEYSDENTFVFYIPIMFELESTNLRSADKEFQKVIDQYICDYFNANKNNIRNFHKISSLSINDRVNEIISRINKG